MLGLLLLYWIGNSFYKLSDRYKKSKWGYAILGVVVYYGGMLLAQVLLVLILDLQGLMSGDDISSSNGLVISIISIPFGLLSCWGLYKLLENRWKKPAPMGDADVLDAALFHQATPSHDSKDQLSG